MLLSNECWLGYHDNCSAPDSCECICHVKQDPAFADLMKYLMEEAEWLEENGGA